MKPTMRDVYIVAIVFILTLTSIQWIHRAGAGYDYPDYSALIECMQAGTSESCDKLDMVSDKMDRLMDKIDTSNDWLEIIANKP